MQKKSLILILAIIGYLIYFISPIDLIPDVTGLFGKLDDIALLIYLIWLMRKMNKPSKPEESDPRKEKRVNWLDSDDPYRILGISQEATSEEIEHAYKKLMAQYKPTSSSSNEADYEDVEKMKFDKIKWAYEELKKTSNE